MSTKQIHPYVREREQCDKAFNRKWKPRSYRRHRNWWRAWSKRYKAEHLKEKENDKAQI